MHKEEEYIVQGDWTHSHVQWIYEGNEGSNLFFNFIKKKVIVDRVLGLH